MGFLVNFVFVIYAFLFEFEFDSSNIADETFYNHDFGYEKKGPATCKSLSQKTVALTQNWGDSFERHQIAQDFDHPEGPSFKGSQFPCDHSSSNGRQSAVEVCRVPPTTQTRCNILPDLSAALAKCHRQDVCSSTRWPTRTSYRGLELRSAQLGLYTTMESGKAALAISNAEVQATLQQCEDTEGAAQRTRQRTWGRHGQRQRCGGTTSTTTDTMAWLRHAWTSSSTHAHAAAPPDDDCDQYRHFICRLQLACHAAATGPASYNLDNLSGTELRGEGVGRDDQNKADGTATRYEDESPTFCQEGRCKSYERLAYSCPTSGTCQTGSRGCLTSTFQPHRIMENLPYRCNPHMAGIRDALSTAGEGRPGQDPRSAGPVQPGQCPVGTVPDSCRQSEDYRDQGRGRRDCGGTSLHLKCFGQDPRQLQDALNLSTPTTGPNRADRDGHASCEASKIEYPLNGRPIHGDHRGRPEPTERAAFYSGRLSMTFGYDSQGPCHHWAMDRSPALIMKWTHRRIHHQHFVSEWQARENAISLALSLHGPSISTTTTTSSTWRSSLGILRRSATRRTKRTCFSSQVEVWIGNCNTLEMYNIIVPELCLACGLSPWSTIQLATDPILLKPDPNEAHLPPLPEERAVPSQMAARREPTNLRELPHWFSQVWNLLDEDGGVEQEDEGEIVYVNSFYISHDNNLFQDHGRPLRFSRQLETWVDVISQVWGDLFDRQAPFSASLVTPEPAFTTMRDTVGILLIVQHHTPLRTAVLTTSIEPNLPRANIAQIAHSFDVVIPYRHVLLHGRVSDLCDARSHQGLGHCSINIGSLELPFGQPIRLHEGLGLTIRIPPPVPQDQWETQLVDRLHALYPPREPWDWGDGDAVNLMARQAAFVRSNSRNADARSSRSDSTYMSTTDSSTSSSSQHTRADPWHEVLLFLRDGRTSTAYIPSQIGPIAHQVIADAFNLQHCEILRLHRLQSLPVDLEELQMDVYLVQLVQDGPTAPVLRFTLVDVEIYLPGGTQPVTYARNVLWLPNFVNRLSLFRLLHLEDHCTETPDRCHLFLNDFEIEQNNAATLDIDHGHYINVYIGACDSNLLDQMLQEEEEGDQMQLFQCAVSGERKPTVPPLWKLRTDQPVEPPRPMQWCQERGRDRQDNFRPTPSWGTALIRRFEAEALLEMEEEGPVAYIVTWLVQHVRNPQCTQPRTVRLGANPADWESNIVEAWTDLIDPELDLHLHHVRPRPIQATTQTILGHVIVEQEATPTVTVVLTTIHSSTDSVVHLRQTALGIPRLLSRAGLLQRLPLSAADRARIPFFRVHLNEIPFGLFEIEEVEPGTHLDIYPPSYRPNLPAAPPRFVTLEDDHDLMNFMQSNTLLRRPTTSSNPGTHSECQEDTTLSTTSTTVPFQFNPNANEFAMPRPALHSQSEFVQELFETWQRSATSWDGEVRSCTIAAWYVNHRWPRPHGHYHRRVQLYENYQMWEDSIRAIWRDQMDPNAEADFYLVYPLPPSGTNDIAAHVIMIQHEHPLWVTSLTSVMDDDLQHEEPEVQLAVTTHEHILFENVLLATDLVDRCMGSMGHPATHECHMWHQDTEIFRGRPYPGRIGIGIQVYIRRWQPPPPVLPGMNLLQRYARLLTDRAGIGKEQERQTDEQVAHTHRPCFPLTTAIKVYSGRPDHLPLPDYVEVARPATADSIQQELTHWGHDCEIELIEDLDIAFVFTKQSDLLAHCRIFLSTATGHIIGPYYHMELTHLETETEDMKFLYSKGHPKAVITSYRASLHFTTIACFHEPFGTLEELPGKPRQPPDWPAPQPVASPNVMYRKPPLEAAHLDNDSKIKIGKTTDELYELFQCSQFPLHTSFEDLQLPVDLYLFLNSIPLLGDLQPDRYIIYVDGSSQGQQQHHPTAWIEEHGLPDAWAMIVLAERYATPVQAHQLHLVGWTAQQVRYDSMNRFHLGSTATGSLTAEREGMIWAFLWRIGQNNMVPTLFRSDSQLTCDQASGLKGATNLDDSFLCLRGAHQLLETALPRGHLKLEHIYGHCGEPFNDFTDLMAKQEALSSFYLPRLKIDMTSWRTKLPHLWLLFAQHLGGPRLHDGYLHTPVPSLPSTVITSPKIGLQTAQTLTHIKIQLSFCTANVLSMYNRPEGYAGKVGYLAEQFQAHGLLFGGIQEARTPEGSCKCQHILRLCSGASHGHGGVELWINLNQPYGYVGRTPLVLKQENVQVIQADPSRILARVVTTYLDIAIFVGHAPHSGHTQEDRSSWWNRTTDLIHNNCGENKPYVMIDANAEPGPADGCSVMTTDCNTSKSTPLWRQFLDEHHLALPQTLPIHVGGLATWTSIDGTTTHCLDYVAVPLDRLPCCTSSQLLESFDLGNEQQDHTPVAVELEWDFYSISPPPAARQVGSKFDRTVIRTTKMDSFLENFPPLLIGLLMWTPKF